MRLETISSSMNINSFHSVSCSVYVYLSFSPPYLIVWIMQFWGLARTASSTLWHHGLSFWKTTACLHIITCEPIGRYFKRTWAVKLSSEDLMSAERIQLLLTFIRLETLQQKHWTLENARNSRWSSDQTIGHRRGTSSDVAGLLQPIVLYSEWDTAL